MVNVLQREKRGDIFVFSARASGRFFFFGGDAFCSLPMITTILPGTVQYTVLL